MLYKKYHFSFSYLCGIKFNILMYSKFCICSKGYVCHTVIFAFYCFQFALRVCAIYYTKYSYISTFLIKLLDQHVTFTRGHLLCNFLCYFVVICTQQLQEFKYQFIGKLEYSITACLGLNLLKAAISTYVICQSWMRIQCGSIK